MLTAVSLPEGVDELGIRNGLLHEYQIEVGGGFGVLKGRLICIGLMGKFLSQERRYRASA